MRRADIIQSITKIQDVINNSGILDLLSDIVRNDKIDAAKALEAFSEYSISYRTFNNTEKEILKIFDLSGLENPSFWAQTINSDSHLNRNELVYQYYRGLSFIKHQLTNLLNLFKQDGIRYKQIEDLSFVSQPIQENGVIITVILPEKDHTVSSHPDRLVKVLNSITLFYKTYAIILGHEDNDLSVISIDSGSDKSFDFLGAAKVMESVKELVVELWDRVVFYREKKLSERIDLIQKSLPIIETINLSEEQEKISPEQAEILRRQVLNGVNDFLTAGAVLPDFSQHNNYNPRQLMAAEPKLLTMPNEINKTYSSNESVSSPEIKDHNDNLTDEEKETLERLLKKKTNK